MGGKLDHLRVAYQETLDATKHQDDKIGRFMAGIAFLIAGALVFNEPTVLQATYLVGDTSLPLPALTLGTFLVLVVLSLFFYVLAMSAPLTIPPGTTTDRRSHQYFLLIAGETRDTWRSYWERPVPADGFTRGPGPRGGGRDPQPRDPGRPQVRTRQRGLRPVRARPALLPPVSSCCRSTSPSGSRSPSTQTDHQGAGEPEVVAAGCGRWSGACSHCSRSRSCLPAAPRRATKDLRRPGRPGQRAQAGPAVASAPRAGGRLPRLRPAHGAPRPRPHPHQRAHDRR